MGAPALPRRLVGGCLLLLLQSQAASAWLSSTASPHSSQSFTRHCPNKELLSRRRMVSMQQGRPSADKDDTTGMERYARSLIGPRKTFIGLMTGGRGRKLCVSRAVQHHELVLEEWAVVRAPKDRHQELPVLAAEAMKRKKLINDAFLELEDCASDSHQRDESDVSGEDGRLHPLYGRCFTNAHLIRDTGEAGIFPLAAMANHSCRPNAGYQLESTGRMRVWARRSIAEGEEVTMSYIDLTQPVDVRRSQLMDVYGFMCECERCVTESAEASAAAAAAV